MAFYIGADKVISDTDATAGISTNSDLDKLQINGTDVLTHSGGVVSGDLDKLQINGTDVFTHDGTTVTLKNVTFDDASEVSINTDNISEGTTNRFYTPTRQTAIETYADTAEADAISTANTYTDTRETAITTAYQSYADTAESDAISTASTDATTKADQALVDAKAYTDTAESDAISTASTDATTKADQALVDAKAYTDQAELDAGSTSNSYTDTAIANLVDTAPATLDTLNELAAALGDDANFSTTVTNQIAALTHDGFADFVANEHIDWTQSGAGTIDPSNYTNTNTNTTYTAGTGLTLTGTVFSNDITNNNQLTNGAGYITSFTDTDTTYTAGTGLTLVGTEFQNTVVNTDTNTTYTAGNGLVLSGTEFTMDASYTGDFEFDGVLTATGDVVAYSDKRLKRNIETISNPIDIVNCLRGVNFEKDGRHSTGVIAQEVEEFLPEVVHTDAEGMKAVAYGNIAGLLIEAIKEQQQTIENLQKQLTDLQNKNS
jgi:hypothetical protein